MHRVFHDLKHLLLNGTINNDNNIIVNSNCVCARVCMCMRVCFLQPFAFFLIWQYIDDYMCVFVGLCSNISFSLCHFGDNVIS